MVFVYFVAALGGIVLFAMVVNRITGTKAAYLEDFRLEPGERELWRDAGADFGMRPRLGQAAIMSFPRLRRHTVVWTSHRVVVTQKPLFSAKHMLTHQIFFELATGASAADAQRAAGEFGGGFYGRGFETIQAVNQSFTKVNGKDCVRIDPNETSGSALNLREAYIFSDRLAELEQALAASASTP